jgi:hypothetical protein
MKPKPVSLTKPGCRAFVDALLERLISEREATAPAAGSTPDLPILHLGAMGAFHRRDIYNDAR